MDLPINEFQRACERMAQGARALGAAGWMLREIEAKAAVFRHYEQLHRDKLQGALTHTAAREATEKADTNAQHAADLEKIIRYVRIGDVDGEDIQARPG